MKTLNHIPQRAAWLALILLLTACGGSESAATVQAPMSKAESEHAEGETEHEGEGEHVELSAEQIAAAGLELVEASPAQIHETLPLYGTIVPNAERTREVAARFPGAVRGVTKRIGDPVQQGETLATVEADESLQTYAVTAPLTGVVTARSTNPGEQTGNRPLFTVADLSTVWVELSLFPRDVAKVLVGQQVRVTNPDTNQSAQGEIIYVVPFGRAESQTLTARVLLDNAERRWAPGLYVTAAVLIDESSVPLAIRSEAVQTLEDRSVVFVQTDDGFAPRPVVLGRSDGEHIEVLSGLEPGARYIAKNSFILKAELGKGEAEHGH
ncbi:MAG: efflux RND transporter periplasmic adaptor subunit [Sinimarinibacterium sp.]|jgi:cobalt-zinc-cadmium efflux system membrane fusion protein